MCQKLQGIVCLVIGLSLLAILVDPLAPRPAGGTQSRDLRLSLSNESAHRTAQPSKIEASLCRIDQYSGWFKSEKHHGEERQWWKWNVHVLRFNRQHADLPSMHRDAKDCYQAVIHSTWQSANAWGWVSEDEVPCSQVTWYTFETPGVATKRFETAGHIPAIPSPAFFVAPESELGLHGAPTEETLGCRLRGIAKDIRFEWNEEQLAVDRLTFQSSYPNEPSGPSYSGEIRLSDTKTLKPEANSILASQLAIWEEELSAAARVYEMASASDTSLISSDGYAQLLSQNHTHWSRMLQNHFDHAIPGATVLREGFRQSLVDPGLIRHRLRDAHERLAILSDSGILSLKPDDGDVNESVEWDKHRDRVVVMGFIARKLDGSAQVLAALDRLRRDFTEDQLFVVACSTDHSQENLRALHEIDELEIPIVHGASLASQLELSSAGIPGILILDRHARPRGLHAWQQHSTYDALRAEVHSLLEEKPFSQSESLVER